MMDVDLDQELLNKLNTLGTRDREDLMAQFQSIVGTYMSPSCCEFYLEMGNWNLQTALCGYYDVMATDRPPSLEVVEETNHKDVNSLCPGQSFMKTWRVKNTGQEPWPNNMKAKYIRGYGFSHVTVVSVPAIGPGETTDVSIPMKAPQNFGLYQSQWRIVTQSGVYCGSQLAIEVNVDDSNILNLTKQMSTLGAPNGEMVHSMNGDTPHSLNGASMNGESVHSIPSDPICTPSRSSAMATPYCSPTGYGMFGGASPAPSSLRNGDLATIDETLQQLHGTVNDSNAEIERRFVNGETKDNIDYTYSPQHYS